MLLRPKAQAEVKPRAGLGRPMPEMMPICWFYNCGVHAPDVDTCKKTAQECKFKHKKVSLDEFNKMERPSRSLSPSRGAQSGRGKGKGKSKSQKEPVQWCRNHLKEGGCSHGQNCRFPHLSAEAVEAIKVAAANDKKAT
jgi:hypothetical protein